MEKKKADALTYQMLPPTVARVNILMSDVDVVWFIMAKFKLQTHLQDPFTYKWHS